MIPVHLLNFFSDSLVICITHSTLCAPSGGDSVSAVNQLQPRPPFSYMSTGGGATLELMEGKVLPGLKAIADAAGRRSKRVTGQQAGNNSSSSNKCR